MTMQTQSPLVTGDIEPQLAIDGSGSMDESAEQSGPATKWAVVQDVVNILVERHSGVGAQ